MSLSSKTIIFLLFTVCFLVYSVNLNNPLFWDDDDWIVNNPFVHGFSDLDKLFTENVLAGFGLNSNYYRPLLMTSFAFNWVLGGSHPVGYHIVSNLLHIGNGILLFLIFYSIWKRKIPAFLGALFFLIHPLQTEAVTYISGRGDPLSVFFILISLILFDRFVRGKRISLRWWSLAFAILAILSRESAVLIPGLFLVYYVAFLTGLPFWRSIGAGIKKLWPHLLAAGTYFILRLTILNFNHTLNFYHDQPSEYSLNILYRLFTFGRVLAEYFRLLIWPTGLHMERDVPLVTSFFSWPAIFLTGLGIGLICILMFLYSRRSKSSLHLEIYQVSFFSVGWFFTGLLLVSGIIPISAIMYEHWLYLPMIGVSALFGFFVFKILNRFQARKILSSLIILFLVGYGMFLSAQTVKRNILWGKPVQFYEDILKYNPNTVRVLNNLANIYNSRGNTARAEELYTQAIRQPNGKIFAQPYYNLGNIYRDRGQLDRAVEEYKKAIEADPAFPFAYQNIAVIYAGQGNLSGAAAMLEKVKDIKPYDPAIYYNLGLIYRAMGDNNQAIENFKGGLALSPPSDLREAIERELK